MNRKQKHYVQLTIEIIALVLFVFTVLRGAMVLWLALYGVSVILSLFFGRFYCGYICPMQTAMKVSQRIKGKIKLTTLNTTLLRYLPFVSLLIAVLIMIAGQKTLHVQLPVLLIYFVLSFLWTLGFSSAAWHTYLCPFSILLKTGGKRSRRHYRVESSTCIGCRKCVKVCPANAIQIVDRKAVIDPALCISCGACAETCPTTAISYTS
ncbi:MAG: 4Fe-4S binding protein [Sphaerochaetaceae bacterium]|nr:4Fe-4S binding protein [Sphaerochaetaceae bacterium]